jgi:SAM-dependent methyltransferase
VASEKKWIMSRVPEGGGRALDLGGGSGELCPLLQARGFEYVNVDVSPSGPGAVQGDAHDLPFEDESFDLVVSSDSLEHFHDPLTALREAQRVLRSDGQMVIWVPFLRPFHRNDYYRYTPLGLQHLLSTAGLRQESLEAPLGAVTVLATLLLVVLRRFRLGRFQPDLYRAAEWLDRRLRRIQGKGAFAAYYLVVARKPAA